MKYWIQLKAPAGNWYDYCGTDDYDSAFNHYNSIKEEVRLVERTDKELFKPKSAQKGKQ